ncbi:MAG: NAD-dependent epimerase/dehydratase family protein [Candidatus Nomurabacteria bacterium]|nr:MAG: NAD-dependent epimerase/dehydratase family protein [Candidatus Nomurabacteria bacterium]
MHYLVTGGAGFIGTNLCEELVRKENKVSVIDNLCISNTNVPFLTDIGVILYKKDIINFEDIKTCFKGVDVVVHLAAMNRAQRSIEMPLEANEVNIKGTLNCLESARQHGVKRFVNISSSSVYANQRDVLLQEDMPLAPPHPYGVGKLAGEHYARIYNELYGLKTVSLRFFSVYGPRQLGSIDKAGVVAKFIHHAMKDLPLEIYGDGTQLRNFSYVSDVVRCVLKACEKDEAVGEIINVANEREVDVNYLASVVKKVVGKEVEIKHTTALKGDPSRNPADTKKCEKLLSFTPGLSFEEGVEKTYEWYKQTTLS